MPSNGITDPANATVVLRGVRVDVNSDVGHQFAIDCARFIEELITETQLRKKYALDDKEWEALADHEELQRAVGAQKERRIRSGEAAREKAAALFVEAPAILGDIFKDNSASPRHRVDAIRELRACASGTEDVTKADKEKFVIRINFGTQKVHREIDLQPIKPEQESLAIESKHEEDDGEYGF
jgi:hypothetical protein